MRASADPLRSSRHDADTERGWIRVVGVSGDVLTWDSNGETPLPTAYLDAAAFDFFPVFLLVRKRSAEAIHRAVDSLGLPVRRIGITPMEQVARDPFWRQQVFGLWFSAFGIAALILTAVGIYGVLAYLVRQRWREIGIRQALGADRRKMLLMVLRQAALFASGGIAIGLAGAYAAARAMRGRRFEMTGS